MLNRPPYSQETYIMQWNHYYRLTINTILHEFGPCIEVASIPAHLLNMNHSLPVGLCGACTQFTFVSWQTTFKSITMGPNMDELSRWKKNHNRQRKISSHSDWFLCCATSFPLKLYCKITAAVLCGGKKKLLTSPFKPSGDWCLKKVGVLHNVLLNRQWYTKQKAAGWKISDIVAF